MDSFVDERDFQILEDDKYTFFMLRRIIGGKCKLLMTDHERLIICYTSAPFPIWIWTPDDASKEEMEKAYQIAVEHSLFNGGYQFNLKYDLAEFLLKKLLRIVKCCPFEFYGGCISKLVYRPLIPVSLELAQEQLQNGNEDELLLLPLNIGEYAKDWKSAQDICLKLMEHSNPAIRANAALGLAYVARNHRKLDKRIKG